MLLANFILLSGSSDLMLAIRRGFDDVAGSLIKGGVDLNQQDNHGTILELVTSFALFF